MNFFKQIYTNKNMLWSLIKSDFKNKYLGSHLGIVWAFIQPCIMIAIYWFVFTHGFRAAAIQNVPFLDWLLAGLTPWFLFNDGISAGARSIVDQSFLVKKIVFEVKLLPIIKIGSAILVNIAFWLFLIICLLLSGFYPHLIWLQLIYYFICIIALTLSLSLLFCAIMPFMLDIGQLVSIFLQIMFWVTPIFWNYSILPAKYSWIYKLNPIAYIVNGVRDTVLFNQPFWVNYKSMIYFWIIALFLFFIGNKIFTKLRPHFADVL